MKFKRRRALLQAQGYSRHYIRQRVLYGEDGAVIYYRHLSDVTIDFYKPVATVITAHTPLKTIEFTFTIGV